MNPKKKMLTLKPGKTNSVLLLTMLLLAIQSVIAHPAESLFNKH
jgi:hypothetical protein